MGTLEVPPGEDLDSLSDLGPGLIGHWNRHTLVADVVLREGEDRT